jgi:hypothetical protein
MANIDEDPRAFTISGFCRSYGISKSFIYKEIAAGRLNARKAGHRTLILKTDADLWAASLPHLVSRSEAPA